jgi:enoyl-CoA hydratase
VRAAVLTGAGRTFSAGLDLKLVPELDWLGRRRLVDALNECFGALYGWPKPLVAAVNGHAIAGGMILALCADWRIVTDAPMHASLAEVRVGVTYPVAPLEIARRELAPAAARRMILLADVLEGREAEACTCSTSACRAERCARAIARRAATPSCRPTPSPSPSASCAPRRSARIDEARRPRRAAAVAWLGEEMRRAAAAVLRRARELRGLRRAPPRYRPRGEDVDVGIARRVGDSSCCRCWRCRRVGTEPGAGAEPLEALVKAPDDLERRQPDRRLPRLPRAAERAVSASSSRREQLKQSFREFHEKYVDIDIVCALAPVFDQPPHVEAEGSWCCAASSPPSRRGSASRWTSSPTTANGS